MKTPKRKKTTQAEKRSFTPADRLRELADAIREAVKGGRCVDWDAVEGGRYVGKRTTLEQMAVDQGIQEARSRFARLCQAYAKCRVNLDISEEEDVWFKDAVLGFQVQRVLVLPFVPDAQSRAYDKRLTDFAWRLKYRAG